MATFERPPGDGLPRLVDWGQVESLFAQGQPLSPAERDGLLRSVEPEMAAVIRQLWADADQSGSFLSSSLTLPAAAARCPGQLVASRFALIELLGAGGMGEVYSARDGTLGRRVALKFIRPGLAVSGQARTRLEREARALCSLAHPHVCALYDLVWDNTEPVLVMEHLEGETLATRLARGRMPLSELIPVALDILDGLSYAHRAGVVHRDLKPGNVMLAPTGAKLFDFGIARTPDANRASEGGTTTRQRQIIGSVSYMSPEQATGRDVDGRSDIFSFGCLLYEMLTGIRAFARDSDLATVASVLESEPAPVRSIVPNAPTALVAILEKCLRKDPGHRYQQADDLRQALGAATAREGTEAAWRLTNVFRRLQATGWRWRLSATAAAVAVVAVVAFGLRNQSAPQSTPGGYTVAVLPFESQADASDLEYIADGLSESVTNALSRLQALHVVARSRAFAYKGRSASVQEIGRALGVRTVVTGRVSRAGDRLRVQADLIDVAAGTQLWGQQYEGELGDLLRFQTDVAQEVSRRLGASPPTAMMVRSTDAPKAYELYLRGRHALLQSTVPESQRAIALFQEALAIDPLYALAYAGLADSYSTLSGMYLPPTDAMVKAKAAALKALEIDPNLVPAHISLGIVRGFFDYDWRQAEMSLARAVELQPDDAMSRLWHGWMLEFMGLHDAALAEGFRAVDLDPLSSFIETGLGQMYYYGGRPEMAITRLGNVVRSAPDFFHGHFALGLAYLHVDRFADAIGALERARRLDPQQAQPLAYLIYAHARSGNVRTARERAAELEEMQRSRYVSAYLLAISALSTGSRGQAVTLLQRAYEERDDLIATLLTDAPFAELRSDPRVQELLSRIGLNR
jgi:serine/threonine-protein kinase